MEISNLLKETRAGMDKAIAHLVAELNTLHTGKASTGMVENLQVESYGTVMRIREVAACSTPDPRSILITPWDKGLVKEVEKAVQKANLGLNPRIDGGSIRCSVPDLSRERRQEMVKLTHTMGEETRVGVRAARRDAMEALKKAKKDGVISEDDEKRAEKDVQAETDRAVKEIATHLEAKEKELLAI